MAFCSWWFTLNGAFRSASFAPVWRRGASVTRMTKPTSPRTKRATRTAEPEMRTEYDFSAGVRGKYAKLFAKGTNLVLLDADVAAAFTTSAEVNRALRAILAVVPAKRLRKRPA